MALHGTVGEFDAVKEDWSTYSTRLEYYFEANDIADPDKKRAILLSTSGIETFKLACNLASPRTPRELTYKELVDTIAEHFNPKKSAAVHRFKFNSRTRNPGETVSTFVAELKKLAVHCGFADEDELKKMLCDRLICGINDARMQRRLLAESEIDFDKAFKLVQASESADKSSQDIEKAAAAVVAGVHRVAPTAKPSNVQAECYRCGGNHRSTTCRFRTADCRYCGKQGHIARVCRSRLRASAKKTTPSKSPQGTHHLSEHTQAESTTTPASTDEYTLFQLTEKRDGDPIFVTVQAKNKDLTMELDTGAALSVISESTYLSTWSTLERPPLKPSNAKLNTYSGESLEVCGAITIPIAYKQQSKQLSLQVLKSNGPTLLGRNWLKHLLLDWKQINIVRQQTELSLQKVLDSYPEVFKDDLGSIQGMKVQLHPKQDAKPHYHKPRPVPYSLRQKVEIELQRLQDCGVIEPVPFSEWAAPIVPVLKRDNTVRICGDYRLTINQESTPDAYPLPRVEDLFATLSGGESFTKLDLANAYQQLHLEEDSKKIHYRQYYQGSLPVQSLTLWYFECSCCISTHYGKPVEKHSLCLCLLGRCPSHWENSS